MNPANEYQVASNHHDVGTELPETQRRDVVTSRWEPLSARLRLLVLTVLTVLAALLLPALHASASGLPAAETRVGAISPTVSTVVGVAEHIAAGQHLGRAPSQLRLVSGHCVAAEGISPTVGELRAAGQADAHHIIQDAAVRDVPGYKTNSAPGIQLEGGGAGTPHQLATNVQRTAGIGGTYGSERQVACMALAAAGCSPAEISGVLARADAYFMDEFGLTFDSPLRIPGNRSVP